MMRAKGATMIQFLPANWLWIVLLAAVLAMHRGGCGGHGNASHGTSGHGDVSDERAGSGGRRARGSHQ